MSPCTRAGAEVERRPALRRRRGPRGVDEASCDDVRSHLLEPMLDPALVSLETLAQPVELWPVGRQPDAEHRDTRWAAPRQVGSSRATAAWLRAPAVCNRARPPVDLARVRHDDAREEQAADDDVLVLGRDHVGRHRGLQRAENGDGQDDADDRATAAEDRDAAEQDDRHHEQLDADPGVVAGRRRSASRAHRQGRTSSPRGRRART